MTIEAKVIAHSAHPGCPDLITLQLRYPRFIHAELMTHRAFSRNASSSRAVPVARMIADVEADIAMPVEWGKNQPGMQSREPLTIDDARTAQSIWEDAAYSAITHAKRLADSGAHKQIVNRVLEPFSHISVVVTATDWPNFFELRCHEDADPTMRALAFAMRNAIADSAPVAFDRFCQWHLPYIDANEVTRYSVDELKAMSVARCARVSYLRHDGTYTTTAQDIELANKLRQSQHLSPFEHQARPTPGKRHANFNEWQSYRNMMEAEQ
jgi:thymidylate synthase ThyX